MTTLNEQQDLFSLIGTTLKKKIECYVIGGPAILYFYIKDATKDIDLVFLNNNDRNEIINVLKKIGFKEKSIRLVYSKRLSYLNQDTKPIILQRQDARLDLFNKNIICFELTKNIIERIKAVYEYSNLIIKVISPEDIILLKCATERAGDRLDAFGLIKNFKINWSVIIDEALAQTKDKEIFSVFLYDFLLELKEDLKADIPSDVLIKLQKISEKEMLKRYK